MDSFGEYLRTIREKKGLGIDQISQKTRINPSFIKALEEDQFENLPGETSAKGFLMSYARSLGLDETETLTRFKDALSAHFQKAKKNKLEEVVRAQNIGKRRVWLNWIVQASILIFIGAAVWVVYDLNSAQVLDYPAVEMDNEVSDEDAPAGRDASNSENSEEDTVGEAGLQMNETPDDFQMPPRTGIPLLPSTTQVTLPPLPEVEFPASVNLPEGVEAPPEPDRAPGDELVLVIEAVEPSWVLANIDDDHVKEVFLQIGDKVRWTAKKFFKVDFGNAGGVKVLFNGKPLPSLGESGEVVKNVVLK